MVQPGRIRKHVTDGLFEHFPGGTSVFRRRLQELFFQDLPELSVPRAALHAKATHEYAALVLFDPPMQLPGKAMSALEKLGAGMAAAARKRRDRFATPAEYAGLLSEKPAFVRLGTDSLELFARTTRRPTATATNSGVRANTRRDSGIPSIPSRAVDFAAMACPVKVIGSDPTVFNSFLPSMEMPDLMLLDYDFVPETTHLMQLEEPETCAALTQECLRNRAGNRR